jgi:hypothetical protein
VLNPITGYVSPHFHIVFDPTFSTVNGQDDSQAPISLSQAKCGFTRRNFSRFAHTTRNEAPPEFVQPSISAGHAVDSHPPTEMNEESTSPAVVPYGNGPSETTTAAIASDATTPANPSDAATSEVPLGSLTPVPRVPAVHPPTEYFNVDPS